MLATLRPVCMRQVGVQVVRVGGSIKLSYGAPERRNRQVGQKMNTFYYKIATKFEWKE